MSAGLRSVVAVALLLAAQALAQDGFCTEAVPDCEDAECKCAGSGTMVTDPVELGAGISVYRHEDVRLPAVLEELSYRRSYTSADETWTFFPVAGPPMPFGPAPGLMPDGGETLRWWHSYFAFAREAQDYDEPPTPSYYVRTVDGRFSEFGRCAPTPCFGTNDTFWSEKERKDRLERTDAGFVHHQKDGRRFVFDSTWGEDGGVTHYFLSRVLDRNGVPAATVEYSTPTGLGVTCREGQSGVTTSGVPYVSRVVTAEGSALQFAYRRLPSPNGGADLCVVGSVGVLDRATSSSQTAVTYAYAADGGTETAGLVASATFSSGGRQLTYAYSPTGFVITGQSTVTHTYTDAGSTDAGSKVVVSAATTPTENVSILYEGSLHGRDVGCIADAIVSTRTLTDSFAQRGDGDAGTAGWTRNSDVEIQFTGNGDPRLVGYEDTCSTPACSPGTGESRFSCLYPSEDTVPPRLLGTKDKRGNWTAYSYALGPDDAGTPAQLELTSVTYGAQDTWGDGGLEAKRFTYSYGTAAHQRHASTEQPSLLGGSSAITETRVVYDGDRIAARLEKGWTKTVGGSTELRYRGVFYFKRHACLGGSNDSLSRTLEVHGPCWVDAAQGFAATDCSSTLNSTVQVAQLFYYPTTMPDGGSYGNKAGRLSKLRSFTDATMSGCGSASYMDMDYEDYDAIGNTTSVRDQNGHLTTMTFQDGRLRTLAKADAGFTFTYDGESVTSVRNPEGNYDVFCWRAGTSGSACTGGTLTDKLQWQAKAPTATGDSFSEKVAYVYWTNGTVASASYLAADGGVLRVERYAVDVHRRPTWQGWGDTSGAAVFSAKRAYDGADNLVGVGHASNAPPAWCGGVSSGAPVSSLCQKLGYDRADRLESASDTGTSQATVFQHDVHGNTTGVKTGCGTSDTYSSCSQPAATYTFDDFGNMVAATLPWTLESGGSGVTRYEFDARGLVVKKQTPSMRAASATYDVLESAWDGVGRPLSLVHRYGSGAGDVEALWAMAYDATGTPPSGCTAPANTMGRLRRKTDSFGDTWYRYDEWGRVTREVRVRASVGNCSGDALDTLYSYSANGNLLSVTHPYGRVVTYTMGTYSGSYSSVTTGRVRSVSVSRYPYGTWTDAISQVEWEPYGGLRGYQLAHATTSDKSAVEYYLGDSQATPGSSNCPAPSTNDGTGNVRALYVSRLGASETWAPGSGSGDILRRLVTWNADMPKRVDTCQLGATTAQREEYAHDSALRLTSASRPSGNFAATGGAYDSRTWSYDTRHNRVSEAADGVTYTLAYDAGVADRLASRYSTQSGTNLVNTWDSDADGRATSKWWPYCTGYGPCSASPAATPFRYLLKPGISGGGESSALESVYQTVSVGGATYSYFYDAHNRRRLKVYPSGVADEYFHSTDSAQLLADVGNLSLGGGGTRVLDEYVWLGGRPVASVRGLLSADWSGALVHGDDDAEGCGRNDDTETHCGLYFLVSDEGGRIVMALDSSRRVSGVGEYDAFGHVNRRLVDGETPHPYPNDAGLTLTAFTAHPLGPDGGVAWTVRANPHLFWSDGETSVDSNWNVTPHDKLRFLDGDGGQIPSGPGYAGEFWLFPNQPPRWTYWLPASTYGTLSVRFESDNQNCCLTAAPHGTWGDRDCNPSTCTCAPNCSYTGVTIDAWQYKKYEAGASPYFVPLRLPGQYHDEETDFFENWNRFYDPSRGAYTSPEPLVHATAFFKGAALAGTVAPTYTYASASPLAFFDVTGLGAIKPRGSASFVSAVTSYLGTEFGRLSSAEVSLAPFDVLITEGTHGRPAGRPDFGHTVPDDKHAMPTKIIITIDTAQVADFKAGKFKFDPYDPAHPHEVEELVAHELGHAIGIIRRTKGSSFGRGWWWSTVNHTDVEACGNGMGWREEKGLEPEDHQEVAKGDCPIAIIRDYKDKQAKRKRKTPPKPIPGPADQ